MVGVLSRLHSFRRRKPRQPDRNSGLFDSAREKAPRLGGQFGSKWLVLHGVTFCQRFVGFFGCLIRRTVFPMMMTAFASPTIGTVLMNRCSWCAAVDNHHRILNGIRFGITACYFDQPSSRANAFVKHLCSFYSVVKRGFSPTSNSITDGCDNVKSKPSTLVAPPVSPETVRNVRG